MCKKEFKISIGSKKSTMYREQVYDIHAHVRLTIGNIRIHIHHYDYKYNNVREKINVILNEHATFCILDVMNIFSSFFDNIHIHHYNLQVRKYNNVRGKMVVKSNEHATFCILN